MKVGNQWQWSNFTIGCDWLGVMVPVAVLKIDDRFGNTTGISDSSRKSLDDAWMTLGKTTSVMLTRLYVGASF